jgi:Zn-dependent protease with chaperone function
MTILHGNWYDGHASQQVPATCRLEADGTLQVRRASDGTPLKRVTRSQLSISPRLGQTPRMLRLASGEAFETLDNDGVDAMMTRVGGHGWLHGVHRLESRLRYVLAGLALLLIAMWAAVRWGIPATAEWLAMRLPPAILTQAGDQTLALLDRAVFSPSQLEAATQARLQAHFRQTLDAFPQLGLSVGFRQGGKVGPNAFALPPATILFTDEIVALAQHDDELLAVLVHEIGHLQHRHALRRLIQDSLLSFAMLAISGDASGTSEIFLGLPVFLTELSYSREFERDADRFALEHLTDRKIPPAHFANLMRRLEARQRPTGADSQTRLSGYLSTHPLTAERLRQFDAAGP